MLAGRDGIGQAAAGMSTSPDAPTSVPHGKPLAAGMAALHFIA